MKAILAVVAVLLAVTHVGDTQGDPTPKPPLHLVSLRNDSNEEVSYNVKEGVNHTCVTLKAVGANIETAFDVTVVAKDGSATYPSDYAAREVKATFLPGETTANACIPIVDDEDHECLEWFTLELKLIQAAVDLSAVLSSPATARVLIEDNDVVSIDFDSLKYDITEGDLGELSIFLNRRSQTTISFIVMLMDGTADGSDYVGGNFPATIHAGSKTVTLPLVAIADDVFESTEFLSVFIKPYATPPNCSAVVAGPPANVSIIDGTASVLVSLRSDSNEEVIYNVKEGVNHTCATLKAVGPNIQSAFDVTVVAKDGSATYPSDYAAREATATFLPGETTANACLPIVDDEDHECLEWFTLELKLTQAAVDLSAVLSSPVTARVLIEDNDVVSIDFHPLTYNVTEGNLGELNIFLDRRSQTNISFIVMSMHGTADGSDYVSGNFPATIHAGMKNITIPLVTKADVLLESTEFLSVFIKPNATPPNCSAVVAGPPANVSIIDGTVPVKFSTSVYHVCTVRGRPSSVAITLEILKEHKFDFTVKVHIRDGTAKRNLDYDEVPVITARFSNQQKIVTIPISVVAGGEVAEPPENFTVELEIPEDTKSYGVVAVEPSTAEIVITDVQIETFSPQNYTVREGEVTSLTIVLDRPSVQDTIFNVATMSLTATTFDDYFRHNYNVTVPAGAMQATTTVVTQRDAKIEAEEHFKAIVRPLVECNFEDNGESTAYITITDCTVLVKFSSAMYTATEGMDPKVVITVLANGAVDESDFTVRVIAKDGTATSGDDYVIKETLLLFKRGESEHSFSINITDDMLAEPSEWFTLELERPQQGSTVCVARGTPDITYVGLADDDVVTVSFSPQNYTVSEGIPAFLGMVLDKEASESITVFVTTMDITAGSADYVQENGSPVKFAPRTKRATLPLLTLRDTVISEPNESLKVTLDLEPTTLRVEVRPDPCFVTITDATVGVNFRSAMDMVGEGDGSVTVTVEASKEHADFEFVIKMVARDGTAEILSDLHQQEVQVTFPAGKTTVDVSIGINDDEVAESDETFYLVLEIPEKATVNGVVAIPPNTTEIKIIDNDDVTITFSPQNYTVTEGDPAPLMIILDKPAAKDITVTVTTMDITATDTDDYIGGSFEVSIPAGSVKVTLNVSTLQDNTVEPAEYFKATLSLLGAPEGCVVGTPNTSHITILDGTHYPQCSFRLCKRRRNALCTLPNAAGNCTFKVTACRAAYYSMDERPPPPKCSSRNKCAGLTGEPLEKCLKKWASCVKKAFKAQHGKTPDNLRKNAFFKGLEYPCGG